MISSIDVRRLTQPDRLSGDWRGASVTHTELQHVAKCVLPLAVAGTTACDIHQCLVLAQFLWNPVVHADPV